MTFKSFFMKTSVAFLLLLTSVSSFANEDLRPFGQYDTNAMPNCRARIPSRVTFQEKVDGKWTNPIDDAKNKLVTEKLFALYDFLPSTFQKVFCSLNNIIIDLGGERPLRSYDIPGKWAIEIPFNRLLKQTTTGGMNLALQRQVNLVFHTGSEPDPTNPVVWYSSSIDPLQKTKPIEVIDMPANINPELYMDMTHELSHFLDFFNGDISRNVVTGPDGRLALTGWASLSWYGGAVRSIFAKTDPKTGEVISPDFDLFRNYFSGEGPLEKAETLMKQMVRTSYISPLAATSASDDWCEAVAYYHFFKHMRPTDTIAMHLKTGEVFDMRALFNSPLYESKRKFIEEFFKRTDLVYPKIDPNLEKLHEEQVTKI